MLAYEQCHRQQSFEHSFNFDSNNHAAYSALDMDRFDSYEPVNSFHPLPFSYFDNPGMFASAPAQPIKQELHRSASAASSLSHYPQHHHQELPPALISSASAPSVPSASSSTVGSPYSGPSHTIASQDAFGTDSSAYGLGLYPTIVNHEGYPQEIIGAGLDSELPIGHDKILAGNFVDPSLITTPHNLGEMSYPDQSMYNNLNPFSTVSPAGSPVPSPHHYANYARTQFSPPVAHDAYQQQQHYMSRRPSVASYISGGSYASPRSDFDEDSKEKGRCPHPDCGKVYKDLKAHMLTHQAERPEKCPILNCEYNQKGFARKYDKNRHTLTHYKGTMVCGFCPGSGSAAEKSFNRADVFKRHLTSVHQVEQTPPNSRKRSPTASTKKLSSYCQDATGKCSTCSQTFNNAQDFYEHLDDCVLRVVQQEEPSEAINAHHLSSMIRDEEVQNTLERHMIKTEDTSTSFEEEDEDEEDEEDECDEDDSSFNDRSGKGAIRTSKVTGSSRPVVANGVSKHTKGKKNGMTWSKGGVALIGKGRKKRKHYPPSWGMSADKMQMKKRVLCVYDGSRRLWKDDMMLHNEFEVRMTLPDGKNYVTDLDVETLKRAEAFHNATEAERAPWDFQPEGESQGFDLNELMA